MDPHPACRVQVLGNLEQQTIAKLGNEPVKGLLV